MIRGVHAGKVRPIRPTGPLLLLLLPLLLVVVLPLLPQQLVDESIVHDRRGSVPRTSAITDHHDGRGSGSGSGGSGGGRKALVGQLRDPRVVLQLLLEVLKGALLRHFLGQEDADLLWLLLLLLILPLFQNLLLLPRRPALRHDGGPEQQQQIRADLFIYFAPQINNSLQINSGPR